MRMASLSKSNRYLRTPEMRLGLAVKTAKDSSAIEGVRGVSGFRYGLKNGRVFRCDAAPQEKR